MQVCFPSCCKERIHSPPCSTELCKKGLELGWDGVVLFAPQPTGFQELAELGHPGYKLLLPAGGPCRQLRDQGSVYLPPHPCLGCPSTPSGSSTPTSHSAGTSPRVPWRALTCSQPRISLGRTRGEEGCQCLEEPLGLLCPGLPGSMKTSIVGQTAGRPTLRPCHPPTLSKAVSPSTEVWLKG